MSKFVYLADTHIRGVNSINRIGNYYSDVMAKIKEVIKIGKKKKVDYIIHGGDLWDSSYVSNVMVDDFIDLVEESKIKWYIVPGNHDELAHNWELSKGSSLAHTFRRSKLIEELDVLLIPEGAIEGRAYYHDIEKDLKEKGLRSIGSIEEATLSTEKKSYKIAVIHAMITPKPIHPQIMHVTMKEIKTNFDIVLCGHNHYAWDIKEMNGTKFINIGAIGRRSINEINFTPKVVYIDTKTKEIELIPLKSAKKGEEVFDITKVETAKAFEANIDNFIKSLDSTKFQSLDLRGLVEILANDNNIEEEVKNCVIQRLGKFEDE